jgi:hypothetical protein
VELWVGQANSREAVIGRRRAEQVGPRARAGAGRRGASIRGPGVVELRGNALGARWGLGEAAPRLRLGSEGSEWPVPMLRRQTVSGGRWRGLPSVAEFNRARLPATGGCGGASGELGWAIGWLE